MTDTIREKRSAILEALRPYGRCVKAELDSDTVYLVLPTLSEAMASLELVHASIYDALGVDCKTLCRTVAENMELEDL